jgi:hypothetical protein
MLIREFVESPDLEEVDLKDDLKFFMHHDPAFYRRVFFPMISKLKKHLQSGKKCHSSVFRPCVDSAAETYCKKFKIADGHKSVFTDVDRDEIAQSIFGEESDRIQQGRYDDGDAK